MKSELIPNKSMNPSNYELVRNSFHLNVPKFYNFARDVIDKWGNSHPEKVALVSLDSSKKKTLNHTFSDLSNFSNRTANFFSEQGVTKGDRVLVLLPRIVEWYHVLLGCFKLGAIPVPAATLLTPEDIKQRINQSEASIIVTDAENVSKITKIHGSCPSIKKLFCLDNPISSEWISLTEGLSEADGSTCDIADTRSDDPLLIYFTSGTTAHPKMVLHTHASYGIGHEITARFWLDLNPNDLHWTFSDTGWAKAAWGSLFAPWIVGASVFIWNAPTKFNSKSIVDLINQHGITSLCASSTMFRLLLRKCSSLEKLSHLRLCASAGEHLGAELLQLWYEKTGHIIREGYGQTETVCTIANNQHFEIRPGSVGKATPGFEVCIVDDEGNILSPGQEGNIAIKVNPNRPVGLFQEYLQNSAATESAFKGNWYYTGDTASLDEDGYFWFKGRSDNVIISSAYRISPLEVESVIIKHPAVEEVAVAGKSDDNRGQIVKAFIVLVPEYEPSDATKYKIKEYVRSVTSNYKCPKEIEFVDTLPRTVTGKICRAALRS